MKEWLSLDKNRSDAGSTPVLWRHRTGGAQLPQIQPGSPLSFSENG
jgi:hypothetical protein